MVQRKRCRYCWCLFQPDPRVKDRQVACRSPSCQMQRTVDSQNGWVSKPGNLGYFKGRYADLKAWLAKPENKNYLRNWRANRRKERQNRPGVLVTGTRTGEAANNTHRQGPSSSLRRQIADIQDEIRSLKRSLSGFQPLSVTGDIQDEIRP